MACWNHRLLTQLKKIFGKQEGGDSFLTSPKEIRNKQILMLGGTIFVGGSLIYAFLSWQSKPSQAHEVPHKPVVTTPKELATPLAAIDQRELWVTRVEKRAKDVHEEAEKVRKENELLEKRVDVLEDLLKSQSLIKAEPVKSFGEKETGDHREFFSSQQPAAVSSNPTSFSAASLTSSLSAEHPVQTQKPAKKSGPKIARLGKATLSPVALKTVDTYVPATTTCKAVMTSGIVVQAGPESENKPEPMTLRLVDDGTLPRGFTSRVKNAEINAACYGNISSERVKCRLVTMTWVEPNGVIVEKNVEGWIYGEDGRNGLRGKVVDRSSEMAREAYFAGILSGFSNFFKFESTSSVYPMSPFGVTNALSAPRALQGAAASGASNALEKLADTSIRRLEQMQPVIVTNAGRLVDVRFKTGFSLEAESESDMKVMGKSKEDEGEA